jgi:hypothetical protein
MARGLVRAIRISASVRDLHCQKHIPHYGIRHIFRHLLLAMLAIARNVSREVNASDVGMALGGVGLGWWNGEEVGTRIAG